MKEHRPNGKSDVFIDSQCVVLLSLLFAQLNVFANSGVCAAPVVCSPPCTSVFLILSLYRKGRGAACAVKCTRASKWCNGCHSTHVISPI